MTTFVNRNTAIEPALDNLGRVVPIFSLGDNTPFSLSAGTPSANIGPFEIACALQVVSKTVVRVSQATAPAEAPEDYAPAADDPILPANTVLLVHLPIGEMFGVLRDGADAVGTITVLR